MTIEDGEVYRDNGLPILKEFVISCRRKKVHPQGWKREGLKNWPVKASHVEAESFVIWSDWTWDCASVHRGALLRTSSWHRWWWDGHSKKLVSVGEGGKSALKSYRCYQDYKRNHETSYSYLLNILNLNNNIFRKQSLLRVCIDLRHVHGSGRASGRRLRTT